MRLRHLTLALALALGVAACGGDPTKQAGGGGDAKAITIGSAAFPENEIIAEIYAHALEAKGFIHSGAEERRDRSGP
jgi:osmoprotectant transport system substrate-binding protein